MGERKTLDDAREPESGTKLRTAIKHSPIHIERTEFRDRLAAVLEETKEGQDHIITRRNQPVALLSNTNSSTVAEITVLGRKQLKQALSYYLDEVEKGEVFEVSNGRSFPARSVFMHPVAKAEEPSLVTPRPKLILSPEAKRNAALERKRKYWREKVTGGVTANQQRRDERRTLFELLMTPGKITNEELQEARELLAAKRARNPKNIAHTKTSPRLLRSTEEEEKQKIRREKMRRLRQKKQTPEERRQSQERIKRKEAALKKEKKLLKKFSQPDGMTPQDRQEALKLLAAKWVHEEHFSH